MFCQIHAIPTHTIADVTHQKLNTSKWFLKTFIYYSGTMKYDCYFFTTGARWHCRNADDPKKASSCRQIDAYPRASKSIYLLSIISVYEIKVFYFNRFIFLHSRENEIHPDKVEKAILTAVMYPVCVIVRYIN